MLRWFVGLCWLLLVASCSAQSKANVATSCDACHTLARCHSGLHDNGVESAGTSCLCEDGLVGDGFTCYNKTSCNDNCCVQGYSWSPLQGCVDIDECSLPTPPCGPDQLCENTPGSYACLVTPDPQHHTAAKTRPRSLVFHCGGVQCPPGQDCLQVNGESRCADPCQHYTPLRDDWRATNFMFGEAQSRCDTNSVWRGWYRLFITNTSVQMPERCIERRMCGTHAPLWLKTPHPQGPEGIIKAEVCGSWDNGCCHFPTDPIHVKACPRNYYVYKFVSPKLCNLAYCADVNTMVCSTCAAREICVSDDKVNWSCKRPDESALLKPELVCEQDHLRLMIKKRLLEERGLNATSAHLIDPRCRQQEDQQDAMWYLVERRKGICGNMVQTNGSHITYSNILFLYTSAPSDNSPPIVINIPFSCVFPLDDISSLDAAIRYQMQSGAGVVRLGDSTRAVMTLYRKSNFSDPFPAGPVSLPLGSTLHVDVSVENYDNDDFVLLLENCYTTQSPRAEDPNRHLLIQNRCPVETRHVKVVENAVSQRARFSMLLFLFHGTYKDIYLHCRISLCDRRSALCRPNCSKRRARSTSIPSQLPVSLGPISWF